MKKYEKPALMVLSLSGNDQLCGSCAGGTLLSENPDTAAWLMRLFEIPDKSGDGPSRDDFAGVFGKSEDQCADQFPPIDSYCKFTSADEGVQMIAWS